MASVLSEVTAFVTAAIGWVSDFAAVITATPILLIFVITSFVGLAVGLIKRIMSL